MARQVRRGQLEGARERRGGHGMSAAMAESHSVSPARERRSRRVERIEHGLRKLVEIPAATVVVAEVVILFAGILARAFHQPLTWSDELASTLFLWLAMLGSAVAIQRSSHMRLTY